MAAFPTRGRAFPVRSRGNVGVGTVPLTPIAVAASVPFAALPLPSTLTSVATTSTTQKRNVTAGFSALAKATATVITTRKETEQYIAENMRKQGELPHLTITKSVISLFSFKDMIDIAGNILISNKNLQGPGSVNDPRLGVVSLSSPCEYCLQVDCAGHYGLIKFGTSIYNPAFIREIVSVLTCVCNDCGKLLITRDIMEQYGYTRLNYDRRLAALEAHCKEINKCLTPKDPIAGGPIKPCQSNPKFITTDLRDKGVITYKETLHGQKSTESDPTQTMAITIVIDILRRISVEDAELLGFSAPNHPRNMILEGILVMPIISRPPAFDGGSMNHDQLTHMYATIVAKVQDVAKTRSTGDLYTAVKQLIFDSEGKKMGMRDFKSIIMRLQGKEGVPRKLLMGKRNNYCGRTVSGPGPILKFGEIGIPRSWASTLTKNVKVTSFNRAHLTELLAQGQITHITQKSNGLRRFYNKQRPFPFRIGDTVERFLEDGDRIVVNRQPTLHRQSIMGYNVKLTDNLTINLHLSYTTPMNNDFDGDENNAWNPQDFEVEAEVDTLLQVKENIMSSEKNMPSMGLVMNSITGAYLISNSSTRVDDDFFAELLGMITDKSDFGTLSARLRKYNVHPRSGQAVVSALLPADFYYNNKGIIIMEGVLVSGRLKKSSVGGSHRSIIQELFKKYGAERTSSFFTDAPWVFNKWLIEYGFSVGLLDMVSLAKDENGVEYDKNKKTLDLELAQIYVQIEALGPKLDDPIEEMYRQRTLINLLNVTEGVGQRLAADMLATNNSIGTMTDKGGGAKGSVANIVQMVGAVGQQNYRGKRLQPSITGGTRLLPTYDENDNNPEANAFIPKSFFTGVGPEGLFFLQAGGREGILDTSLKTAETGSMQHRMIKAFENIVIAYDGSVRNTIGTLFSPMFGAGYDIGHLVAVETPGKSDFSSFIDLKSVISELNNKRGWVKRDVKKIVEEKKVVGVIAQDPFLSKFSVGNYRGPEIIVGKPYNLTENIPETISPIKITRFEKTRIIGTRATQLSNNAPPLLPLAGEIDPIVIATKEFEAGVLKIYVIRKFPDGTYQTVRPELSNI